jgi:hypothetical protein
LSFVAKRGFDAHAEGQGVDVMRVIQIAFLASSLAGAVFAVGCSSSSSNPSSPSGDDAGGTGSDAASNPGDDANTSDAIEAGAQFPAFTPADVPQVANFGGPVMAAPKIVPIFFASDDATTVSSIKDFVSKFGATQYWSKLSEYGVGAATGEAPIDLTAADSPPASWDDSQIQAFLSSKLSAHDPAFRTPDPNTIYAFFTPPGVTVTMGAAAGSPGDGGVSDAGAGDAGFGGGVSSSCTDFGGYHNNIVFNNNPVAYAVVPRCTMFGTLLSGLDAITGPASHELGEAATDPFPSSAPAYASVDRPHSYWSRLLGGGEVGDMCAQNPQSFTKFSELPYTVQRLWSNKAAMAGSDPCLPVPSSEVYFNAFPVTKDTITVTQGGQTVMIKGVHIAVGASASVEVDLFSSGPVGPWTVEALASDQLASGATTSQYLGFSFDKTTGQNGDKLTLTINVKAAGRGNREPFLIVSKIGAKPNEQVNFWAGEVGN